MLETTATDQPSGTQALLGIETRVPASPEVTDDALTMLDLQARGRSESGRVTWAERRPPE